MVTMPEPADSTTGRILDWWEGKPDGGFRAHLGASIIGKECDRAIWYDFRWTTPRHFPGRLRRLFDRGVLEEKRFIEELHAIGCEVYQFDPVTKDRIRISDLNGHFGGELDAMVKGVPESPEKWHVAEFKTANERRYNEVTNKGVESAMPEHYAQVQVYMLKTGVDRALYLCVNKNTDELYAERIRLHKTKALGLINRAARIIATMTPPERMSEDPSFWKCKFCDHYDLCHTVDAPHWNCRTCAYVEPREDGTWYCNRHKHELSDSMQRDACDVHLIIPELISNWADATELSFDKHQVTYQNKLNGRQVVNGSLPGDLTSKKIYETSDKSELGDLSNA